MEIPNIGKRCSNPDCKQLDFLPLQCSCKLVFCREHFLQHVEECTARKDEIREGKSEDKKYYQCSEESCKNRSIVPLICEKCNNHFCVTHRHVTGCSKVDEKALQEARDRCNAPKIKFQAAKTVADQEVETGLRNARRKGKGETANKVQLMRLKVKATGLKSIPTTDRIYFSIFNEKFCPDGRPVFISQDWTIGRSIDAIAEECKIPNNNNKLSAPKLRLFKKDSREIVSNYMSDKIHVFISDCILINGESLIMDYIEVENQ